MQAELNTCFHSNLSDQFDLHCAVNLSHDEAYSLYEIDCIETNGDNYCLLSDSTVIYNYNLIDTTYDSDGFTNNITHSDTTWLSNSDSDDYEMGPIMQNKVLSMIQGRNENCDDDFIDNNLLFDIENVGMGKAYISEASAFPPELNKNITIGAIHPDSNEFTHALIQQFGESNVINSTDGHAALLDATPNFKDIPEITNDHSIEYNFIGDSRTIYIRTEDDNEDLCLVSSKTDYEFLEHKKLPFETDSNGHHIIDNQHDKWFIRVPVRDTNGNIKKIRLFADSGADSGCVNTAWAIQNFSKFIVKNKRNSYIRTGSGREHPKYVLWMTFPAKSGLILKARLYLMDNLPVDILADINMLKAFGYTFRDETPPIFKHPASKPLDLETKDMDERHKINFPTKTWLKKTQFKNIKNGTKQSTTPAYMKTSNQQNPFDKWKLRKDKYLQVQQTQNALLIETEEIPSICDSISHNGKQIYHHSCGSLIKDPEIHSKQQYDDYKADTNNSEYCDVIPVADENLVMVEQSNLLGIQDDTVGTFWDIPINTGEYGVLRTLYPPNQFTDINMDLVDMDQLQKLQDPTPHQLANIRQELDDSNQCFTSYEYECHDIATLSLDEYMTQLDPAPVYDYCKSISYKMHLLHSQNVQQQAKEHVKQARKKAHQHSKQLKTKAPTYYSCMFIMAKQAFLANQKELNEAAKLSVNKKIRI